MKSLRSMLLVFPLAMLAGPAAAGVVAVYSANGAYLYGTADTTFVADPFTVTGPQGFDHALATPPDAGTLHVTSTLVPDPASGKDGARGTMELTFTPGAVGVDDSFGFVFYGVASAERLRIPDGSLEGTPAAAQVLLQGTASFYIDAGFGGVAPGALVGHLTVPTMPAAGPFESFSIGVSKNGILLASFAAGDLGGSVPLFADAGYVIAGKYQMLVPSGSDPAFSVRLDGAIASAVPAPASAWMLAFGASLLALRLRASPARA